MAGGITRNQVSASFSDAQIAWILKKAASPRQSSASILRRCVGQAMALEQRASTGDEPARTALREQALHEAVEHGNALSGQLAELAKESEALLAELNVEHVPAKTDEWRVRQALHKFRHVAKERDAAFAELGLARIRLPRPTGCLCHSKPCVHDEGMMRVDGGGA